jgi:hypothetical protein
MTENHDLFKPIRIRVPRLLDLFLGRDTLLPCFSFFLGTDEEYITIENGVLIVKGSISMGRTTKSFQLKDFVKLLLEKREVSSSDKGKWNILGRLDTEIELSLVTTADQHHVLVKDYLMTPSNHLGRQLEEWDFFLNKLCAYTGLPLEKKSVKSVS